MTGNASMAPRHTSRYGNVAIALHWLTAAAILVQLSLGLWMVEAIRQPAERMLAFQAYQWHKSLGLTVLALTLARLGWRLLNPPPPLPATVGRAERLAAHAVHWLFYGLMVAIPLLGWAMVSASPLRLPTVVFGVFEWPHVPWLAALENKAPVEAGLKAAHRYAAYLMAMLVGLHVAAALKHHLISRDEVLRRMLPFMRPRGL